MTNLRFQAPPPQYDQNYFNNFIRSLTSALGQTVSSQSYPILNLPTSPAGLPVGSLYNNNGTVMVVTSGGAGNNIVTVAGVIMALFVGTVTAIGTAVESLQGATVTGTTGSLIDANGNMWTLVQSVSNGLQVADNSIVDNNTSNAVILLYWNHTVYYENANNQWFDWTGSAWQPVAGDPRQSAPGFYVSTSGNDSSAGSFAAPFLTLEAAQTAMRNSSTIKTTYVMAGAYSRAGALTFTAADVNCTYSYYPADGVDTAVLDGGSSASDGVLFNGGLGAVHITINGLKFQNFTRSAVWTSDGTGFVTITNCEMNNIGSTFGNIVCADHWTVTHNYIHDSPGSGITYWAFGLGSSCDGTVIDSNVVMRVCTSISDNGAIYGNMRNTNASGGHVKVTNNYVKDYGANGVQCQALYFDDDCSNVTATGNILGPPASSGDLPHTSNIINNRGCNNTVTGNIIDTGPYNAFCAFITSVSGDGGGSTIAYTPPAGNKQIFQGNLIINNFTSATCNATGFNGSGHIYDEDPAQVNLLISNNIYHNYGGGSEDSTGNSVNDSNPVHVDPLISGWTYTIASNSPAFNTPVNFPAIVGGWGPLGFTIPQVGVAPSCPH